MVSLVSWLKQATDCQLAPEELARLDRATLEQRVIHAIEDHYRPEMRRLEAELTEQLRAKKQIGPQP